MSPVIPSANVSEADEIMVPVVEEEGVPAGTIVVPRGLLTENVNAVIPTGTERIEATSGMNQMTGIPVQLKPVKRLQDNSEILIWDLLIVTRNGNRFRQRKFGLTAEDLRLIVEL